MTGHPSATLTAFQIEVARFFFSLPTSGSFLLAGGAALLVALWDELVLPHSVRHAWEPLVQATLQPATP